MPSLPQFTKTGNPYSPFTFDKGRYFPVNEPVSANQTTGMAGGGAIKVVDHGDAEQFRRVVMNNVSPTNRNNLLNFIKHSTVNYKLNTFTFTDEDGNDHVVNLWKNKGLDLPQVKGGNYNIDLLLRDKIPLESVPMPSFSVYQQDAGQSGILNQTSTKLVWNFKESGNWLDDGFVLGSGASQSRWTPGVLGEYFFCAHIWLEAGDISQGEFLVLLLYKNGAKYKESAIRYASSGNFEGPPLGVFGQVDDVDDYFELLVHQVTGVTKSTLPTSETPSAGNKVHTWWQGVGVSANNASRSGFSAYQQDAGQSGILTTTNTKMEWNFEEWDLLSNFVSHRFTLVNSGQYLLVGNTWLAAGDISIGDLLALQVWKNGVIYKQTDMKYTSTGNFAGTMFGVLVDGDAGDYFEMFIHQQTGVTKSTLSSGEASPVSNYVYFQGHQISDSKFPLPSFSAFPSAAQSGLTNNAWTQLEFDSEEWDTHGAYNVSTFRFTPGILGKYIMLGHAWLGQPGIDAGELFALGVFVNGDLYKQSEIRFASSGNFEGVVCPTIVDITNVADYIELHLYQGTGASRSTNSTATPLKVHTWFQGIGIP